MEPKPSMDRCMCGGVLPRPCTLQESGTFEGGPLRPVPGVPATRPGATQPVSLAPSRRTWLPPPCLTFI